MTDLLTCDREGHEDRPAVARLVYWGQGATLGEHLCREDATCVGGCGDVGAIVDAEYEEPWCQPHANQFPGEETVSGPEIVLVDSDRYREVVAEVGAA